jgi:hypothetical protein
LKNSATLTFHAKDAGSFDYTGTVTGKGHLVLHAEHADYAWSIADGAQLNFDGLLNLKAGELSFAGFGDGTLPTPTPQFGVVNPTAKFVCTPQSGSCKLSSMLIKQKGSLSIKSGTVPPTGASLFVFEGTLKLQGSGALEIQGGVLASSEQFITATSVSGKFSKVNFINASGTTDITSKVSYSATGMKYTGDPVEDCNKVDAALTVSFPTSDDDCYHLESATLTVENSTGTPPESNTLKVEGTGSLAIVNNGTKAQDSPTFNGDWTFAGNMDVSGNPVGFNVLSPNAAIEANTNVEVYQSLSCKEITGSGGLYVSSGMKLTTTCDVDATFAGTMAGTPDGGSFEKKGDGLWNLENAAGYGTTTISIDAGSVAFSRYFGSSMAVKDIPPPPKPGPGPAPPAPAPDPGSLKLGIQSLEVTANLVLSGVDDSSAYGLDVQSNITINPHATLTLKNANLQDGAIILSAKYSINGTFEKVMTDDGTDITSKVVYNPNNIQYKA